MVISAMIQEDSKLLWPAGFIKSKKILMYSSGATFQQKKIQQMLAWSCLNAEWESSNSRWFQGSSFWRQEEEHWPNQDESIELATDDPELKKILLVILKKENPTGQNLKESLYCYCAV